MNDNWETPPYFFDILNKHYHFTLDPCASDDNHLCDKYYTEKEDGLKQNWEGHTVFCNPPYSKIDFWLPKCYNESLKPNTTVVLLVPNRLETKIFTKYIWRAKTIYICIKRINFLLDGKRQGSPRFSSVIIVFGTMDKGQIMPKFYPLCHR